MKIILTAAIVFSFIPAFAQKIIKIEGVMVTIGGDQGLKQGQTINFLDSDMNVKASGVVEKSSPQGKMGTVKITSGQVQSDYTFEKIEKFEDSKKSPKVSREQLSEEEKKILDRGEISDAAYIVGGILGTYPLAFGLGHVIQGRWTEMGWIFTVTELIASGVMIAGATNCFYSSFYSASFSGSSCGTAVFGAYAWLGLHIWEIVDLWAAPPTHNRRYKEIKARTGLSMIEPLLVPREDGFILGLQYRF